MVNKIKMILDTFIDISITDKKDIEFLIDQITDQNFDSELNNANADDNLSSQSTIIAENTKEVLVYIKISTSKDYKYEMSAILTFISEYYGYGKISGLIDDKDRLKKLVEYEPIKEAIRYEVYNIINDKILAE